MNELVWDLAPRYVPTKFYRNRRRIAPGRALTGLCLQTDILEKKDSSAYSESFKSGVYQLGVPQDQGDSSAPSTTDPLICGFCLVTTPNTRGMTAADGQTDNLIPVYPPFNFFVQGYIDGLVYWRMYVSLSLSELIMLQ